MSAWHIEIKITKLTFNRTLYVWQANNPLQVSQPSVAQHLKDFRYTFKKDSTAPLKENAMISILRMTIAGDFISTQFQIIFLQTA